MNKKKILIVSSSFYPKNSPRSFRTTELVKEFAREGHEVTLLTPKYEDIHTKIEEEYGITIKNLGHRKLKKLDISNSSKPVTLLKRAVNRGLNLLFYFPHIEWTYKVKEALQKESGYDLLISIAAPHSVHWGVAWAWRQKNPIARLWVADCGDPFMGTSMDTFNKLFYFRFPEKQFCSKADYITVPLEEAKQGYYPEFRKKIKVIPQGFNFNEIEIDKSAYQQNDVPTFAYAGGLIPGSRDPSEFLEYLVSVQFDYKFILYTKSKSLVKPWLEKANGKIEIREYLPRKELLKILSRMDFLVNFENKVNTQMPSKLIDYYLTGRPVLSVPASGINKQAVNQFLAGDYSQKYEFENMEQYKIENVCQDFLRLLDQT